MLDTFEAGSVRRLDLDVDNGCELSTTGGVRDSLFTSFNIALLSKPSPPLNLVFIEDPPHILLVCLKLVPGRQRLFSTRVPVFCSFGYTLAIRALDLAAVTLLYAQTPIVVEAFTAEYVTT